jgi:hypothetical protein
MANETPKDANEVNKALETRQKIVNNISRLNKEQQANFQASLIAIKDINAEEEKLNQLLDDTQDALDKVSGSLNYVYQSFKDSVNEMKKGTEYVNMQKSAVEKLSNIARTALDIRKGESLLEEKKFKQLQDQARQRKEDLELALKKGNISRAEKDLLRDQIKTAEELEASMKDVLATDKEILKTLGFVPKVAEGIDKALSKLGLPELGFKEALDNTRMLGQEAAANGKSFSAVSTYTGLILNNIKAAASFANLLTLGIGAAIVALMDADKHTGELAKNLGVSYNEATDFHHEMADAANNSDYLLVTTNDLIKAQMKLSDAIGTGNNLSKDLLDDFAGLTEQAGYSEEAMMGFGKIVASTGEDLSDMTSTMLGQIELQNQQNGLSVNSKQLVEEISKTSAATVLTYGRSGEALAKAAFQAKQVGINLEQAASIANNLLNFEDSISAELEAELLTGKDLNLEKARQLALEGDIAGAAKAALENIKSAEEFLGMNVVQQEALAKAAGLSRDDLATSLMQREALARLGKQEGDIQKEYNEMVKQGLSQEKIAEKLGDKKLASQLKSVSAQEKLSAVTDKLKEVFTSLVTPLLPVLQVIGDIVSAFTPLFRMIGQVVKFSVEWGKVLLPVYGIYKGIQLLSKAGAASAMLANTLNKAGLITDKQKLFYKQREIYFENQKAGLNNKNLIIENASIVNSVKKNALEKIAVAHKKMQAVQDRIILGIQSGINAVKERGILLSLRDVALAGLSKAKQLGGFMVDIGRFALTAARSIASIPIIGPVLAVGAAAAAVAGGVALYNKFKGDDIVSPGYGKRTLFGPEGSIQLNDKDTVIAGTNLEGNSNSSVNSQSVSPSINLTPLIERMSAVENILTQIFNKEGNIFLDGQKVGTTMALGNFKTQ